MEYVLPLSTKESKMKDLLPMTRMKCNKLSINEFEVMNIWKKIYYTLHQPSLGP